MNRRSFIKSAAVGAGAILMPSLAPAIVDSTGRHRLAYRPLVLRHEHNGWDMFVHVCKEDVCGTFNYMHMDYLYAQGFDPYVSKIHKARCDFNYRTTVVQHFPRPGEIELPRHKLIPGRCEK